MNNNPTPDHAYDLIETLRWTPGDDFVRLELHLDRLCHSAQALGFAGNRHQYLAALQTAAKDFPEAPQRVRLLLTAQGRLTVNNHPLVRDANTRIRYVISNKTVDSNNRLLQHKTTRRALFDDEHRRLQAATGCDEVLFTNEKGELTEGSRSTLFVETGAQLLTPPLACGLLDGVLRRHLLQTRGDMQELILYPHDLTHANAVFLGNSLRGLREAEPLPRTNTHSHDP